jgi:hypothetical protein
MVHLYTIVGVVMVMVMVVVVVVVVAVAAAVAQSQCVACGRYANVGQYLRTNSSDRLY